MRKLHEAAIIPVARFTHRFDKPEAECDGDAKLDIEGMITAVYAVHSQGIMHRNIRPESFAYDGVLVLRHFEHAILTGQTGTVSPDWGPRDPSGCKGLPYDIWCLGLCIFGILYPGQALDDLKRLTAVPLPIRNDYLYRQIVLGCLDSDPDKRFCAYALKNMCDIPAASIWGPYVRPYMSWATIVPRVYNVWLDLVLTNPLQYQKNIDDELLERKSSKISIDTAQLLKTLVMILNWRTGTWTPSWVYTASVIAWNASIDGYTPSCGILDPLDCSFSTDINAHIRAYITQP